jgi:hypothetical protein
MTLKEAAESMVVVVKGDLKLDYFKLWANGDELLHEVEKEGYGLCDDATEQHVEDEKFVFEGVVNDLVVLSVLLSSGEPSNKHHYLVDEIEFCKHFVTELEEQEV